MPLADLSLVTSSLRTLMDLNMRRLMGGVPPGAISISTLPPEKVGAAQNTLNLHLYHIAEDRYYKNMPGPGNDARNIARAPMALALFYILTAHHEQNPDIDALTQQRLMGLALKTMHDYPIVGDRLMIDAGAGAGPQAVLHPALQGDDNPLQIILRPLTPEDTSCPGVTWPGASTSTNGTFCPRRFLSRATSSTTCSGSAPSNASGSPCAASSSDTSRRSASRPERRSAQRRPTATASPWR